MTCGGEGDDFERDEVSEEGGGGIFEFFAEVVETGTEALFPHVYEEVVYAATDAGVEVCFDTDGEGAEGLRDL